MTDTSGLRNWCWTTYTLPVKVPETNKHHRYTVYQIEKCPETGKIHAQGYTEFTRTMRMKAVKDAFEDNTLHLEPRQGTRNQARQYCMKEESREEAPKEFGEWMVEPGKRIDLVAAREKIMAKRKRDELYQDPDLDQIMTKYPKWAEKVLDTKPIQVEIQLDLFPWQQDVIKMLDAAPLHRRIIWIWSNASGTGKTTFKDYCSIKYDVLPADGKLPDILYAYDNNQVIWFDFTRAQQGYESYHILEKLSNHTFHLSTKYEPRKKYIKAHVVVTSNHPPDEEKLPMRFLIIPINPCEPRAHEGNPPNAYTESTPQVVKN